MALIQDALQEDDDDDDEEEEEEASHIVQHQGKRHTATFRPPSPVRPPSSELSSLISSSAPQTPRDTSVTVSISAAPHNIGKVRVIKQWTPNAAWVSATRA